MPKRSTAPPNLPREEVVQLREIMVQLGRALCLSIATAASSDRTLDDALAAQDRAWTTLADKVATFAELTDA
jgi:hypothetical protein